MSKRLSLLLLLFVLAANWQLQAADKGTPKQKADGKENLLDEDFENGLPEGWNVINAVEGSNAWEVHEDNFYAHSGTRVMKIKWEKPNDDWLITPKLTLRDGDLFSFWGRSGGGAYLDDFEVKVSKAGNIDPAEFAITLGSATEIPTTWSEFSYNLTDPEELAAGDQVYIAVRCTSNDKMAMYVDDFKVDSAPEGIIVELDTESHSFGTVNAGETKSFDMIIKNTGSEDLVIANTAVAAPFFCDYSGIMVSGQTKTVTVSFLPVAGGAYAENLIFNITGEFSGVNTVALTGTGFVMPEGTVQIGEGEELQQLLPLPRGWTYSYSQSIFLQSELALDDKQLTKLYYNYDQSEAFEDDVIIYMGHTDKSEFTSTADWMPVAAMNVVYNGKLTATEENGWVEIILDTPFNFNNSDNLVIGIVENTPGFHTTGDFYCSKTPTDATMSIEFHDTMVNPDPLNPPEAKSVRPYRPNIRLQLEDVATGPAILLSAANYDFGNAYSGKEKSFELKISNVGSEALAIENVAVAAPFSCEFSGTIEANESGYATIKFTPVTAGDYSETLTLNITGVFEGSNTVELSGSGVELAEGLVQIGEDKVIDESLPFNPYFKFSYSQSLFLQSELNENDKQIEKIYYQFNRNSEFTDDIIIYMAHSDLTEITDWVAIEEFTEVFNGQLDVATADWDGWIEIILDTQFAYNNSDNLIIALDENTDGYHTSADDFYCSTAGAKGNMSIEYHKDSNNPDPANPPTEECNLSAFRPNVRLQFVGDGSSIATNLVAETFLYQNYPNPFNPNTTIRFFNKMNGNVKLSVFNVKGELVQTLVNGNMTAEMHSVTFDAASLNSGVYYYKLETEAGSFVKKMMLVK